MPQLATGASIVESEGVGALWKGLPPAVLRGLVYGGGCASSEGAKTSVARLEARECEAAQPLQRPVNRPGWRRPLRHSRDSPFRPNRALPRPKPPARPAPGAVLANT
jgi:hypothetical protein